MAADTENPFGENFSIQDTMEMGLGNADLLAGLLDEGTGGDPNDITPIVTEVEPAAPAKPPKTAPVKAPLEKEAGDEPEPAQNIIANFLAEGNEPVPGEPIEPAPAHKEDDVPVSTFTSLAKDLLNLGVFTTEEGQEEVEIKTPQAFLERFNQEKEKGANEMIDNFLAKFGQDYQDAFQAIYVKGVNPKDYFGTYNKIVNFAEIDLTIESNQVAVINQALEDQGYDPEDITTEIERLRNYGDLETVATKHHKVLVKKEAIKLHELETRAEQELQTKNALKNQYMQNVNTILQEKLKAKEFDGIPLNPKLANELHDFLLVDKWKTSTGENLTDFDRTILELKRPENHAMKVKVALLLKILEKDPTLATIQRSGITKKSDELFANTARQVTKIATAVNNTRPNSWFTD
jgi:hypothetical protein